MEKHAALQTFLEVATSLGVGPSLEQNKTIWNINWCDC